jgi:hypothetical protein
MIWHLNADLKHHQVAVTIITSIISVLLITGGILSFVKKNTFIARRKSTQYPHCPIFTLSCSSFLLLSCPFHDPACNQSILLHCMREYYLSQLSSLHLPIIFFNALFMLFIPFLLLSLLLSYSFHVSFVLSHFCHQHTKYLLFIQFI